MTKVIEIAVGEIDRISLHTHSGTGYMWMLSHLPGNILLVDVDEGMPIPTPKPGGPTTRVFTIVGEKPGKGKLEFVLARPWQPDQPVQRVTYHVVVEKGGGIHVLYGVAMTEARESGDLAEMKRLAAKAREAIADHDDLKKELGALEAEIKKAGG